MMARKRGINFSYKGHAVNGIISTVLGVISILVFIILVLVSYWSLGNAAIYIGSIGMSGFIISIVGVVLGIKSFSERDKNYLFSKIGTFLSIFVIFIWISIYIVGFYF